MANEIQIGAQMRTEFGKGAARRIRRNHQVPAVIYGHGEAPIHITMPGHDTLLALRAANALLAISVDGAGEQLALPRQVQRDPIRGSIEHVDLVIVKRGEKVVVEVPLVVVGEDKAGHQVNLDQQTVSLEVEATNIPGHVEIDITDLEVGEQVFAGDLVLPPGAVFHGEADDLLLSITQARSEDEIEAELDAAVSGAAHGEGGGPQESADEDGDEN